MIDLSDKYFMMIEPDREGKPTVNPIEDKLTRRVDFIFSKCKPSNYCYKGFHMTGCGKSSDNRDWVLPNGMITNSLCTYYIRHYREFIPESEIGKINRVYDEMMMGSVEDVSDFKLVNDTTGEIALSGKVINEETSSDTKEKLTSLNLQLNDLSIDIYVDDENLNKLVDFNKRLDKTVS